MIRNSMISEDKNILSFLIKFIILVVSSYVIIRLSIEAKEIEEKRNVPGLRTTMEFAEEYMRGTYEDDWEKCGGDFIYPDRTRSSLHYLEMSSDDGILYVYSPIWLVKGDYRIEKDVRKDNNSVRIEIFYKTDMDISVWDNGIEYYIEYESGNYIPNLQMERETGFTTDEIVKQQEKIRSAFEEEMKKMHEYQIGRAKERRKMFTDLVKNIFLIFFLCYLVIKWGIINIRADIENKYPEEVMEETLAKSEEKFFKIRYLLLGCGISFWTYILISVISEFILLPIVGTTNEYAAYGISAVISAAVFGLLWESPVIGKTNIAGMVTQIIRNVFQFILSSVVTLTIILLGVIFIPRFCSPEKNFYKINILADGIAFLIFSIIVAVKKAKKRILHKKIEGIEKGGLDSTGWEMLN